MLRNLLQKLRASRVKPLNSLIISEEILVKNYQKLSTKTPGIQISPVLKSNAYGHGLTLIADIIDQETPPFICVDSVYEAFLLKNAKIKSPILVMGAIDHSRLEMKNLPFMLTITDSTYIELFERFQANSQVHLFIDTGMNREGVRMEDLETVLIKLKETTLNLVGIMSHLAVANNPNHPLTLTQIQNFQKARELVEKHGLTPKWWHLGGGDTLGWIESDVCNLVRCGRILYGVDASEIKTSPIMKLETTIVQLKEVKKGENVGYFATYKAQKDIKTAVLPIGYNDGVDKRLSNQGVVQINSTECPIIGLISMNMTVVDVSLVKELKIGDKAIIFSEIPEEINSIEKTAKLIETNPSDLLVGLHPSTRREIV